MASAKAAQVKRTAVELLLITMRMMMEYVTGTNSPVVLTVPPAITTVSKERYKLGQLSAKRLIYKLSNVDTELPERILMPCGLLQRETVSSVSNVK